MNILQVFFRNHFRRGNKSFLLLVIAAVALLLSACGSSSRNLADMPVNVQEYSSEEYQIGVGDQIRIEVWGNERLSLDVPVRPDGKISMSLIGDVLAAGFSTNSLSESITSKLLEYIKNPQVSVIVTNPSSSDFQQRIRVTGAVNSPQSVPYRKGMTVLDLVLLAGGPNEFAVPNDSKLYRKSEGQVKVYPIYLDDILKAGKLESNYMLVPSDIVTIPERSF
ncbi:Periplasmic protein involved in polysaccharide export [marine gamma proteobacterium HTCC2143]|uniref:Periplasmic protein involved in polysaccharide export n=1 Tax=marine gamma proteobacterium HTCC2143 TaxID=247633 RepID=A0YGJ3_9GAMM|nr:Periplasmic protein involved in polysaccharide export [marine gamma proteobacterium HTCC2143]